MLKRVAVNPVWLLDKSVGRHVNLFQQGLKGVYAGMLTQGAHRTPWHPFEDHGHRLQIGRVP